MASPDYSSLQSPFIIGAGTSAYQVEGAIAEGGRGPSIWDTFSHRPGVIKDNSNGNVACDHYYRFTEDIALMKWMGLDAYRFSIAWPRIIPDGVGRINEAGLDFYDRLVDTLLKHDIKPYPTLYHWDLPSALEKDGGWLNRDTAYAFEAYAVTVAKRLGDRIPTWFTHSEPWCQSFLGYELGIHAPGHRSFKEALQCAHHLLLSHGLATRAMRGVVNAPIGPSLSFTSAYPGTERVNDILAAQRQSGYFNSWFLDPIAGWGYPEHMVHYYGDLMPVFPSIDLDIIAAPVDVIGINYYERNLAIHFHEDEGALRLVQLNRPDTNTIDRKLFARGLGDILRNLHFNYGFQNLMITANGAAFAEQADETGFVNDTNRIDFINAHLAEVVDAQKDGVPINAYFVWSLMDSFDWNEGYCVQYGLWHVDRHTLKRTPKASAAFLRSLRAES